MSSEPGTAQSERADLKTLTNALEAHVKSSLKELKAVTDPKASGALPVLEHWKALHASLERLEGLVPSVVSAIAGVQREAEREFDEAEAEFRDQCGARKWVVSGQWPDFYVEYGIPVGFVKETRTANVSGRRTDANASSVVKALEPLVEELIPPKFSEKAFVDAMAAAYDAVVPTGGQAAIFDVYKSAVIQGQPSKYWRDARASGFKGMSLDQFRARLTRCLRAGRQQDSRGRSLRLFPALNPADAVFVFQPSEQRFGWVGRIEFVHEQ